MRATYSEVCNLGPNEGTPIFPSLGNLSCINNLPPVLAPDPRGAATVTLLGWVAGVGFEYGFTPNWSAKVEYTYMDFGTKRMVLSDGWPVDVKNGANILKVGVNYRFAGLGPAGSPGSVDPKSPRPMQNWIGCYVGIQGGGVWGRSRADSDGFTAFGAFPPPPPGPRSVGGTMTGDFNTNGAVGGGTAGCGLLQNRDWVLGVESDLSWSSLKGTAASLADPTERNEVKESWISTWRPRFGATLDNWLIYATGGLAVAEIEYTVSRPGATTVSEKHTRPGWTVGGGVERTLNHNWSVKAEYLYADLGREAYLDPPPTPIQYVTRSGGVFLNEHIVRAGINYKFDGVLGAAK